MKNAHGDAAPARGKLRGPGLIDPDALGPTVDAKLPKSSRCDARRSACLEHPGPKTHTAVVLLPDSVFGYRTDAWSFSGHGEAQQAKDVIGLASCLPAAELLGEE